MKMILFNRLHSVALSVCPKTIFHTQGDSGKERERERERERDGKRECCND